MSHIIAVAVPETKYVKFTLLIADLAKNHFLACGDAKKKRIGEQLHYFGMCLKKKFNKSWSPKTADNIYKNYLPKVTQ